MLGRILDERRKDVVIATKVGRQERHGWARFTAAQMYYSLVGRDLEHEVLPFVQDAGIGTMIWSPLAWLLAKPGMSTLLLGASKPHQLEDNLGAVNVHLSPEELRRLDGLSPHASYDPNWFTTMVRDQATDMALGTATKEPLVLGDTLSGMLKYLPTVPVSANLPTKRAPS